MDQKSSKKFRAHMSLYIGCTFLGIALGLLIAGVFVYRDAYSKEKNYKQSTCFVFNVGYRNRTCRTRYTTFNCYSAAWKAQLDIKPRVNTTVESEKRYQSPTDALNQTATHKINNEETCWYDGRQPTEARWKQPTSRLGRIFLICGGVSVFMGVFFLSLSIWLFNRDPLGSYIFAGN
ncbi:hypothetical protein I4U23_011281 [Adineta vaga]|nr:hypothetical protein I4U23_011281 [Adineta vaga]